MSKENGGPAFPFGQTDSGGDERGNDTKGSRKALGAMNAKLRAKVGRLERELATVKQSLTVGDDAERAAFEAVAWRVTGRDGLTVTAQYPKWAEADCLLTITPLYTHPAATVPAGPMVVPGELLERCAGILESQGFSAWDDIARELRALLEVKP